MVTPDRTAGRISAYAASLAVSDITPEAAHAVKRCLIDSAGCALGAFSAEPIRICRTVAARVSSTMPASVLGTRMETSPDMAAFVNSSMVRYLDFNDDYLKRDGPHPSDNIPAVLAVGEALHVDGKTLACGITLAYEIVDQLVDSAEFSSRGWDYVTETSIGSALGAGKMMGLSKMQMREALALAIAPNIALWQTRLGKLSMWKGCAGPNGARNGVFAAMLAREGMTGPDAPIEGPCGLWKQVTGKFELGTFGGNGKRFKIQDTFFKFRPVVYPALLPVEVALELRKKVAAEEIASLRIHLDRFCAVTNKPDASKWDPRTRETADHSVPYLVAAALVDGDISDRTFTPTRYRDAKILGLMKRLTLEEDPEYTKDWPKTFHCRLEVTTRSGKQVTEYGRNPKGHPANTMTDVEIEDKFLGLAGDLLGAKRARRALDLLWNLEKVKDVSQVTSSLVLGERIQRQHDPT